MYRFPGQEKGIAERWYKKYQEAQEKFNRMKPDIIKQALSEGDWDVRRRAIDLATGIDDEVLQQQVKEITRNHFKEYDVTSTGALYNNSKDSRGFGGRLNKTGSEIILIDTAPGFEGKSFKGKIITREIQIGPFLAWKKAYENHEAWKEAGYDYVPIEPILYFSVNKDMTVRVYTGVLDKDVDSLGLEQDKKLKETLEKIGVHHGHLHDKNVCTLFPRDAAGKIIIDGTMPRQYIIDFDIAHL
jgi:hypothetical protein